MSSSNRTLDRFALGVLAATALATAAVYRSLPARIATHFDWHGQPDSWQPRALAAVLLPALAALLFVALRVIVPRCGRATPGLPWVSTATVTFLCALHVFILGFAKDARFDVIQATCAACGALYVVLGLVMPRLRQNRYVGVRTPWTLRSPEVWSRTQRLAGWLFSAGGTLIAGSALLAPSHALPMLLIVTLLITASTLLFSWKISTHVA